MKIISNATAEPLSNKRLQGNLRSTIDKFLLSRKAAVSEVPNWEELRDYARKVKLHTLSRLYTYLQQLERQVEANGGKVVWADSGSEALQYIKELASKHRVRKIVKSKTMLGEEIALNHNLEEADLKVVETDLGEYIVQLCDEPPFHIVTPALHKSKEEVAELFSEKLGMSPTSDVGELTATARRVLREEFLEADLGISGVNFGVAETGTIVVVENEGNARLSTSLPRIHVALMGIEKVLPRMSDLSVFLKLLSRSATGQKATSYVNLISGPKGPDEVDGPEEFHLVLVDNGRSSLLPDPFLRQTLACIRCGACLNVCPVFQKIGGHAYNSVYQGPIGAILTPQLVGLREVPEHSFASSLCGACHDICPVKIEIPHILLKLRERTQRARSRGISMERIGMGVWAWVASSPGRYGVVARWARRFGRLPGSSWASRLFPPLAAWQRNRALPSLPRKALRDTIGSELKET